MDDSLIARTERRCAVAPFAVSIKKRDIDPLGIGVAQKMQIAQTCIHSLLVLPGTCDDCCHCPAGRRSVGISKFLKKCLMDRTLAFQDEKRRVAESSNPPFKFSSPMQGNRYYCRRFPCILPTSTFRTRSLLERAHLHHPSRWPTLRRSRAICRSSNGG